MNNTPPEMPPHAYELPLGFTAHFSVSNGRMEVRWEPREPGQIRSPRHRRKFFDAYRAARREFMPTVATVMGGGVLIVDTDDGQRHPVAEVVAPAKRH